MTYHELGRLENPEQPLHMLEIQDKYGDEYHMLTSDQRQELCDAYADVKKTQRKLTNPTAKGAIADVTNTCRSVETIVRCINITSKGLTFKHLSSLMTFAFGLASSRSCVLSVAQLIST